MTTALLIEDIREYTLAVMNSFAVTLQSC